MKTISKIIIYPIKSLNGISVPSAKLTPAGFNNDRKFMLVDVIENKMITLREFPDLYKLNVRFITNDLIQIEKFREYVAKVKPNDQWLFFIEGWCMGVFSKYNEDIYKWSGLRKRKLKNIENGKST